MNQKIEKELETQVAALGTLVQLQKNLREADSPEALAFAIVNDTHQLCPYRQAVLWNREKGIVAVSGLPDVDRNSPYIQWVTGLFNHIGDNTGIGPVTPEDLPESVAGSWSDWLPQSVLAVPLKRSSDSNAVGVLLLAREEPFYENEVALLEEAAGLYGWGLSHYFHGSGLKQKTQAFFKNKKGRLLPLLAILVILCLPVRISVLAPAEIAPRDPVLVRVPIAGVIHTFHIKPNDPVKKGQRLFDLDGSMLENQLAIAEKAMLVARAEYRKTTRKAVFDAESKMELAVRKGMLDEKEAEVKYYSDQLQRINVTAPEDGIAVFADVHDWLGRAVSVGEKVLSIADPKSIEIVVHLPMADAIPIEKNAPMKMFLNVAPNHPVDGEVNYVSYRAQPTAGGILAYRLKGRMIDDGSEAPRIGLSGTAKIYGGRASVFYYLFRRPLSAFRQWFGI